MSGWGRWLWLLVAGVLLAGCGVDAEQSTLCRRLIPAFEDQPARILDQRHEGENTLIVAYETGGVNRWIACRFAGRFLDAGRHTLEAVATSRTGVLTPMRFTMLRLWARLPLPAVQAGPVQPVAPSPWKPLLFLAQQLVNAITVACVYGLLAVGYTLIYGILGQINLAMGELTMLGAIVAAMAMAGLSMGGAQAFVPALVLVLALSMLIGGAYGWTMNRLVFRHLQGVRSHTPLIAAVGLGIAMQEGTRLLQGAREWWPPPVLAQRHDLMEAGGFTLTVLTAQLVILGLAGAFAGGLWWIMHRTAFGRTHRACTDHLPTAELLGVHVPRTVALTFLLGGACAGAAGCVIALYYGGVNFYTGYQVGFKALAAAVVGGVGSVPGALLGGALLGVIETFWSGYFAIAYKDIVAFGLLTLFLIFRPNGIMGVPESRGD
ncbi:branched-chain amino acid transport system permease protein [Azospirillum fermentarium]|uniref:branched-chain amino acid ABC transporter permease n=1 Tax=Azospirillum fermentarium TaxID=1233114 RepID=UPI002226E84E|nr:branched-chain amino acid ABC transporter permease [Azospirillum fermentarium]MCW2246868.1 branched-chain amino acid transport system permease protein [Azospirillum fermentarium]